MKNESKIKLRKVLAGVLCTVLLTGTALSVYATAVQFAPVKLQLDVTQTYQTMQGFGASAAWHFQELGKDEAAATTAANMLYGDDGMKLEVIRYNIGAGTKEIDNGYTSKNNATESFFISENYLSKASFSDPQNYDLSRDKYAMRTFDKCLETGNIRTVVLFANSPHYLLTESGKGNGAKAYQNNLPEENYGAYSDYLLNIADLFAEKLSKLETPPRIYVSPVNEPQWRWGGDGASQEGCHYDPKNLAKFLDTFYTKLKQYNASHEYQLYPDFFDSGGYAPNSDYKKYLSEFSKYPFFDEIETLSFHSYHAQNGTFYRNSFASYAKKNLQDKTVFMSEFCVMQTGTSTGIDMGLHSAGVMMKDLTILSAAQWCWWLGAAPYGYEDGLVYFDRTDGYEFGKTKRYSTLSQFTRFVSSGDVRVHACTGDPINFNGMEVCAFKKPSGEIVTVLINSRNFSRKLKLPKGYNLESFTYTDEAHDLYSAELTKELTLPAKSVSTLVLTENK